MVFRVKVNFIMLDFPKIWSTLDLYRSLLLPAINCHSYYWNLKRINKISIQTILKVKIFYSNIYTNFKNMENGDWLSNIASRKTPNGGTTKNIISRAI